MLIKPFFNLWDYAWPLSSEEGRRLLTPKLEETYALADRGPYLIDPQLSAYTIDIAERCRQVGSTLTLGFRIDPHNPDRSLIEQAMQLTNHLAIANNNLNEWHHFDKDFKGERAMIRLQEEMGFEWRCPLVHTDVIDDRHQQGAMQKFLVEHKVPICCLCGYMLTPRLDLPDWLAPLTDPWTGAGRAFNLGKGSYAAVRRVGFTQVVCTPPIPAEFPT